MNAVDIANTGEANMQLDLAMLERVQNGEAPFLYRLYTWHPWCVSLGYHQKLENINVVRCKAANLDIVRRPTGGRAVFHAQELTYCIVVNNDYYNSVKEVYTRIHELLHSALKQLVPDISFQRVDSDLRKHYASSGSAGQICFSSSAKSELMINNKKVVGSAQRVIGNSLLQHGSILIGNAHEQLAEFVTFNDIDAQSALQTIQDGATTLQQAVPHVNADTIFDVVERTFRTKFHKQFSKR